MPIDFTCPNCLTQSLVADSYAGQSGPCAKCGQTITIPVVQAASTYTAQTAEPQASTLHAPGTQMPPPTEASDFGTRMLIPVDRSLHAICAGYVGLFAVLFLPAPIALLLGILAIRDIKKHPEKHGLGRAWFGVIMGTIFTLLGLGLLALASTGY